MKIRRSLIVWAGTLALPAIANAGLVLMPGERGYVEQPEPMLASRARVVQQLEAWKRNPVTGDGWREVGGQAGWVYVGVPSSRSRAQVRDEVLRAARDPVTPDGWRFFTGELGWAYVGPAGAGSPVLAACPGSVNHAARSTAANARC